MKSETHCPEMVREILAPNAAANVRFGSLADIGERTRDVRFTPESGHADRQHRRPLSANSGHQPSPIQQTGQQSASVI